MFLTSLYAGRLESMLRHQMRRDASLSADLQQMSAKVIRAQEEERRMISRELHDEVGQALLQICSPASAWDIPFTLHFEPSSKGT